VITDEEVLRMFERADPALTAPERQELGGT
jgi:hypothetical protein